MCRPLEPLTGHVAPRLDTLPRSQGLSAHTMTGRVDENSLDRYRAYLQDEIDRSFIYLALGELENEPALSDPYRRLAATEERHALDAA